MLNRNVLKVSAGGLVLAIFVLAGIRSSILDNERVAIPQTVYKEREWIPLDDSFLSDKETENTEGYSVQLIHATTMDEDEFIARYAKEHHPRDEHIRKPDNVLAITVKIRNKSNRGGGIGAWEWRVVPNSNVGDYVIDGELFGLEHPEIGELAQFSIPAGEERTTTLPFVHYAPARPFEKIGTITYDTVGERSFHLNLSNLPVQKRLEFSLSD